MQQTIVSTYLIVESSPSVLEFILWAVNLLCAAFAGVVCAHRPLHLLQLESYQLDGYERARRRTKGLGRDGLLVFLFTFGIYGMALLLAPVFISSTIGIIAAIISIPIVFLQNRGAKKPFKRTKRALRLMSALLLVNLLLILVLSGINFGMVIYVLLLPFQAWLTALTAVLVAPLEKAINMRFFRDAQRKLAARTDIIKIGITGSYGKTSTKFILAAVLGEKYNVLATPSSFNTPMGLTRVIREQLKPEHEVFIAEMGARHVGDIKELCELVRPTIGAITSVGPQHLETFFSLENVASTKYELIEALPIDGKAFFGDDGGECTKLFNCPCACEKTLAGLGGEGTVRAENISVGLDGSSFDILFASGKSIRMNTQLLGAHNIQNITLCCAIAEALGLTPEQIAAGVAKAPPVEHRLQLIKGAGGNIVIDDAFNSNPEGARAAMEVLSQFPPRRIVVTPGMVELGEREEELNRVFGAQMAKACEVAILIGEERTRPIREGLLSEGFTPESIITVPNLDAAAAWIAQNSLPGDVTLFENDLPDNY